MRYCAWQGCDLSKIVNAEPVVVPVLLVKDLCHEHVVPEDIARQADVFCVLPELVAAIVAELVQ